MELFGQRHAGHKGRYFSIGINNLVNTFPASPQNIANALSQGLPVRPEVNPALEVEVAAFRKVGVGVHAARRSLGVPYRHDVTWFYQPDPDNNSIPETVPAGAFPYKWNRIGIDLFFYRYGYQAPYGRYIKFSLTRSSLTINSPQNHMAPFQRDYELVEKLTFYMPSIGFGRKVLVHDKVWLGIGAQYTADMELIRYRLVNIASERGIGNPNKELLYDNSNQLAWGNWNRGVSNDPDHAIDMRLLVHQMIRLSFTMSVGILL